MTHNDGDFAPRDAAQFAWLAWRVHGDEVVEAAYRLGSVEAVVAMLMSEWVLAQGTSLEVLECSKSSSSC